MRTTTAATAVTAAFVAGMLIGPASSTADEAPCQTVAVETKIIGAHWQNHRPTYTQRTRIVTATTTLCAGEYDTTIAVRRTDDAPRILFR